MTGMGQGSYGKEDYVLVMVGGTDAVVTAALSRPTRLSPLHCPREAVATAGEIVTFRLK